MPSGLCSVEPGCGIQTRRTGAVVPSRVRDCARARRWGGEGCDPIHTCSPCASLVLGDVADRQEPDGPGVQQEALALANCADIVTTGGSVPALWPLQHLPLETRPGECVPSIHRSRDRVHSVSTAMCAFPIHGAGSPSASPLAVPEALASETIPHGPRLRRTPAPWERWRARRRESEASVPPFLEAVWRGVEGRTVRRGTAGCPLDHGSPCPAFPHALVGQADHPRRRVVHHDDAVVRSWAYPYTTLLGGMRGWIPRDRLSRPLHNVEGQSQSWGVCLHPGIEERGMAPLPPPSYHRPCGLDPSSLALQPFRGNGSQRPLERGGGGYPSQPLPDLPVPIAFPVIL